MYLQNAKKYKQSKNLKRKEVKTYNSSATRNAGKFCKKFLSFAKAS